ncbi:MAG: hypothetical protein ACU843_10790, partial [Gammaproteobacteria bacterium]
IERWHEETLALYAMPLEALPVEGKLIRYGPPDRATIDRRTVLRILENAPSDTLGVPRLSTAERELLFAHYAPVFEIDIASDQDRPGQIQFGKEDLPIVNPAQALVYRQLSHARLDRQVLLQLNYTIWFPSRPSQSPLDILSGHLDGITWRVTLLRDGRPWIFDTIHNCGCYHLFFPTRTAQFLSDASFPDEPLFVPQAKLRIDRDRRLVLRIASRTHYIERVYSEKKPAEFERRYAFENAAVLRSLPLAGGSRKSLYGENGIIDSSRRAERFLFWPMGVPSPGAMRQWGHHATAFVGRRHFDDPHLLERNFAVVNK